MSTPLSFKLSYLQDICLTSFYSIWRLVFHCVEQELDERCQRRRGPGSSYDVMSRRSILGFWAQMMGLQGQSCHTWCCLHTTWTSWDVQQSWHAHPQPRLCWVLRQGQACLNRRGSYTHLCSSVQTKAHSCTNKAKSLTITLLPILRDSETRLTDDTCEGALCVRTRSLGACSGQRTLINIWQNNTDC